MIGLILFDIGLVVIFGGCITMFIKCGPDPQSFFIVGGIITIIGAILIGYDTLISMGIL